MSFLQGLFGPPDVEALKAKGNVKKLIKTLDYDDYDVRQRAIQALVEVGEPAVEPLIAALQKKNFKGAAEALGQIGDARAVEPLIAMLESKGQYGEKVAAVQALGRIGDTRAIEPLVVMLKDYSVGESAAKALMQIGESAIASLLRAFRAGDPYVYKNIKGALVMANDLPFDVRRTFIGEEKRILKRTFPSAWLTSQGHRTTLERLMVSPNRNGVGCPYYAYGVCKFRVMNKQDVSTGPEECSLLQVHYKSCHVWKLAPR
jgi:hypothetical protein